MYSCRRLHRESNLPSGLLASGFRNDALQLCGFKAGVYLGRCIPGDPAWTEVTPEQTPGGIVIRNIDLEQTDTRRTTRTHKQTVYNLPLPHGPLEVSDTLEGTDESLSGSSPRDPQSSEEPHCPSS